MDAGKTQPPKKKDKERKTSLPVIKAQSRICIDDLRTNFQRQISLPKEKDIISLFDPMAKAQESAVVTRLKTGVIYDEIMIEHYCLWDEKYPEKPSRLSCILERCKELSLFNDCEILTPVPATMSQIKTVHSETHYDILKQTQNETDLEAFKELSQQYDSIYFNQKTFDVALLAAGCALELAKSVLDGKVQNGMALIRPPGHHASIEEFCGYCFFNNVALAAKYALTKVDRVLIVDWDVHHGQATQRTFYEDPRVLFFSSHRYENGKFWPKLRESDFDFFGAKECEGFSFNIPLNQTHMKNADFLAYFHQVLLPVAYEFCPQLVLISCGYDAAVGCPEGEMDLTPAFYAHLTSMLMQLAGGKVAVILEGGYCLESLSESAMHTLRTLMGNPCPRLLDPVGSPCESMRTTLLNTIYCHRPFWKCLQFQSTHTDENVPAETTGLESLPRHVPKAAFEGPPPSPPGTKYPIYNSYPEYSLKKQEEFSVELKRLREGTSLDVSPAKLSLVYDADMEKHFHIADSEYVILGPYFTLRTHPERPERTKEIMSRLEEFSILDRVIKLQSRRALRSELCLVHEDKLVDLVLSSEKMTPKERRKCADKFVSVYFNEHTSDASRLSAGSLLQVVDAVCEGRSQSGIGVIRPPGHHAEVSTPMGFCFFNNVCIAADYAMQKYSLKRVLIVDWDVHHGNGVQHYFESSSSVLYISLHVYKDGNFYPFSPDGNLDHVGKGDGRGYNVNIPWEKTGMGDGDYVSAFTQVVLPIAYQFDPDLVLVSAGFDAAVNDPLGGCSVTPECYGHLTHLLSCLANGKIILALEGGYNLTSVSYAMAMCAKALLGDPLPPLKANLRPSPSGINVISKVIAVQKEFWSSLQFQVSFPEDIEKPDEVQPPRVDTESPEVFLTPPQSPTNQPGTPLKPPMTKAQSLKTEEGTDDLEAEFSRLNISSDVPEEMEASGGLEPGDEGAAEFDPLTHNTFAQILQDDSELHAVVPLDWCPHLIEVALLPEEGILVTGAKCQECHDGKENWQCLTCYAVLCGRYVRKHMLQHGEDKKHHIVLSHNDLSVWCYACESYVHNEITLPAKQSAYRNKFGDEMP